MYQNLYKVVFVAETFTKRVNTCKNMLLQQQVV